jgi:capsular polysaccharide biosynthesis protein
MTLIDYGRILLRRGWIMLLLATIVAASAFFLSRLQTPIYRATQTVLIQPARADLSLTESTRTLLRSYAVYLDSDFTAVRVIDVLQLDMTPGDLNSRVIVNPDALRLTIQIEVELPDRQQSLDVAQEFGNQLVQYRFQENQKNRLEDRIDASLADVARAELDRPRPALNAAAGGVLGLIVGALLVFLLEYLESAIVRQPADIERTLSLPVLASIPQTDR